MGSVAFLNSNENRFVANDMRFVADSTILGEARAVGRNPILWAGLAGVALLVGLTGPFGTYTTMQAPLRLIYWALVVMTCYWIGLMASFAAATWLETLNAPPALSVGLGALVASIPITLWLSALHAILLRDPFFADFVRLLPYVAVISLTVNYLSEAIAAGDTRVKGDGPPKPQPS